MDHRIGAIDFSKLSLKPSEKSKEIFETRTKFLKTNEKFADALFDCYGDVYKPFNIVKKSSGRDRGLSYLLYRPSWNESEQEDVPLGPKGSNAYEYLSEIPNNAEDRINAIRKKIEYKTSHYLDIPTSSFVDGLRQTIEKSVSTLSDYADSTVDAYKKISRSSSEIKNLMKDKSVSFEAIGQLGLNESLSPEAKTTYNISLDSVSKNFNFDDLVKESDLLSNFSKSKDGSNSSNFLNKAVSEYGPFASKLISTISQGIDSYNSSEGSSASGDRRLASVLEGLGSIASAIPIYGQFASVTLGLAAKGFLDQAENWEGLCKNDLSYIDNLISESLKKGFPFPYNVKESFDISCPEKGTAAAQKYISTNDTQSAKDILNQSIFFFEKLSPNLKSSLKKWWSYATLYSGNKEVTKVLFSLMKDCAGGAIASDEQVMLVAAPIAVANGFDIDDFAKRLWKKSKGWRSSPENFLYFIERGPWPSINNRPGGGYHYIVSQNPGKESWSCFTRIPANSWWIQFGVLANDAFDLANDLLKEKIQDKINANLMSNQIKIDEEKKKKNKIILITAIGALALLAFVKFRK